MSHYEQLWGCDQYIKREGEKEGEKDGGMEGWRDGREDMKPVNSRAFFTEQH